MIRKITLALCLAAASSVASLPAIAADGPLRGKIRVVIGSSSTGGDTYQNTAMVAEALSEKLGLSFKVDAVGVSEAYKALGRDKRGSTIMMFHDHSYLGNLYGVKGFPDPFEDFVIGQTVSINPGNAYLVPKSSPYQSVEDIIQACANGTQVRVAIQPGGVSEIGYSAIKNAIKIRYPGNEDNLVAINSGSQADKDQLLFDGQVDLISGSVQANEQYTRLPAEDQKAMRFVWITSRKETIEQAEPEGLGGTTRDEFLQYVSPEASVTLDGTQDFTFDKEFFFIYNKEMDPAIIDQIDATLAEIYADGAIQEKFRKSFFIPNFMPAAEARAYLKEKHDAYAKVIEATR
ncbi:MAG: Bug family tripartite tricarboxylate transporter substrate binding protein [Tropicimonas sp.]|uniref:Bug family tripartite tricarboxylate transporter substrate binding protein n=1 Tax=Tropicimonas sp. TaxID=2067044 RepID=UPI003A85244C